MQVFRRGLEASAAHDGVEALEFMEGECRHCRPYLQGH